MACDTKYHEQHLENEFKRALETSREACLQSKPNQEKSAHIAFGGHIPSYLTIFSFDHQTLSFDPSYLRIIMEGSSASTADFFPTTEGFEGPFG